MHLPKLVGDQRFTSNPSTNMLVGRDGGGKACEASYETSWGVQGAASKVRNEREPAMIHSHKLKERIELKPSH
jgi:hypothetical protein